MTLLTKLGIGVLGLGTSGATGYGIYELSRSKTIEEVLWNSRQVLKTKVSEDDSKWTELVNSYTESINENSNPKGIKDFTLSGSDTNAKITSLKEKCKVLLEKIYEGLEQRDFQDAKNWCSKDNTQQ